MWLEVDVSQMKDRRQESIDTSLLVWGETQDVHGTQQTPEVFPIVLPLYGAVPSLQAHIYTHCYQKHASRNCSEV